MKPVAASFAKALLLAALLASPAYSHAKVATPIDGDSRWKLIFDEEFNGSTLDASKWGSNWLGSPGSITKPVNSSEFAAYDPAQVRVSGGYLNLTAIEKTVRASDGKTYNYVSGLVHSKDKFEHAFGYFEARMYLPGSSGSVYNWAAFWTNGDHAQYGQSWPYAGENDIMESLGGGASYHFHSNSTHAGGYPSGDWTGWHVFAALWEPGVVTYYYDGKQIGQLRSGITSLPQYLILNLGLSTEHGGPLAVPSTVLVDYVHVYSSDSAIPAITPQAGYGGPGDTGDGIDSAAPSVPANLQAQAVSSSQVNLTWSASTDNSSVAGYLVYRDGVQLSGQVSGTSKVDSGLNASTTYSYQVAAFDASGNLSAKSTPVTVTTQTAPAPTPNPTPAPPPTGNGLILNPSFESGLTSWSTSGFARIDSSSARSGSNSAYVEASGSFNQVVSGLNPNTKYILSAYLRAGSSSAISLGVKNFGGTQIALASSSPSFEKISIAFTTGASSTSAQIFVYGNSGNGRADDFELVRSDEPAPTPAPTPEPTPSPTPTPSALVLNPSFESGLENWTAVGRASVVSGGAQSGNYRAYAEGSGSAVEQVIVGLSPNTTYTLSAYLKAGSRSRISLGVKDHGGSQVASATTSTSYRRVSVSFKTGSTQTSAKIFLYVNSGNGSIDSVNVSK